jgi:hypothetical protein
MDAVMGAPAAGLIKEKKRQITIRTARNLAFRRV